MTMRKFISLLLSVQTALGLFAAPARADMAPSSTEKYSVTAKAAGAETVVDTAEMTNSQNVSGYLVTVARDGEIVNQYETERADSVTVAASEGDDIEIAPVYEYKETEGYGNGRTLPDAFPDGRYNITVTNGSTSHVDVYVNGYMVANNIDQNGAGRSVSTGSAYTANNVRVEGGSLTIQTKDSPNALSYVRIVKSPSVAAAKKKIFITGDSLVADYYGGSEGWYCGNTQTGWGQALKSFINSDKYEVVNLANAGYWAATLQKTAFPGIIYNAGDGDIFLLESGVNDYWNPTSGGKTENLPENRQTMKTAVTAMVEGAKAAGLPVILVTPNAQPSRHEETNCFSDVMLEVAGEQNVPVIDLAAKSSAVLRELYYDEDPDVFKDNIGKNFGVIQGKKSDYTHSSYLGAMKYASIVATELCALGYTDMFDTEYEYTKRDYLENEVVCKVELGSISFTPAPSSSPTAAPTSSQTVQPMSTPTAETVATENASEAPSGDKCVKITAEYNGAGGLEDINIEEISVSDIEPADNTGTRRVFYWDSLSGMEPVAAPDERPTATPTASPAAPPVSDPTEDPVDADYTFEFGASDSEGITVAADMAYKAQSDGMSYGFYGLLGSPDVSDGRTDGFKSAATDPYTVLKAGKINGRSYVAADYSGYDEDTLSNMAGGVMPIRFSVGAEQHKYYTVTVTAVNTSADESAEITLYSEKRHAILAGYELAPGESVTKTFNVNLESIYYNGSGLAEDTQLNVSLAGRNAGLSRISVKKHETPGKTVWMCTDSTGCDQPANIPYFALRNYSGTGSALAKYINPAIAVSNQGEGGLTAGDSNHFNNAVAHMNEGDYLYVQYGLNDSDTASFKTNLEKYYTAARDRGVKLIIVSPSDRHGSASWDSGTKQWKSIASGFAAAGREFVEEKISGGADNIAYIDLNTAFIDWMNDTGRVISEQRQRLGFGDTDVDSRAMDYYYLADRQSGVDTIHINDYGTDNAAYIVMREAKKIVEAGKAADAANSAKIQSDVLAELVENMSIAEPCVVSDEIVKAGWPINGLYPYPSSAEVDYRYPTMVKGVDIDGGILKSMTVKVQGAMSAYAQGCADILNENGEAVSTVYTSSTDVNGAIGHIDNTSAKYGDIVTMYFDGAKIPEGGSYRVYLKGKENGAELPGDEYYSSVYAEPEAVRDYLVTSADGTGAECFDYGDGESIVGLGANSASGANAWAFAGSSSVKRYHTAEKDGLGCAVFSQNGSGTYSLCKFFNGYKQISSGKIKLHFQINYSYGSFTLKLNQSGKIASWMDGLEILRVSDGEVLLPDGTPAGRIKTAKWTDIDAALDIDRGIAEISIAGGDGVSCDIAELRTSSWSDTEKLLPIKGITLTYTKNPSTIPSYPFELYMTDLLVATVESETPQITVNASSENAEMGTVSGAGTVDINSDVTLTALPAGDNAFAGWYSGDTLYSSENPLTLERVRENITLTAKFTEQKPKTETASFDITVSKAAVRKDSTLQLGAANAKSADNIDIKGLEASDIAWSSTEPGVNISSEGVVSFDTGFTIDDNAAKTVTVTGSYNNVTETRDITVYSYAYYELMNSGTTDYDGAFQTIAGSESIIFPTSAGTGTYTLAEKVTLDRDTSIVFGSARNQANQNKAYKTLSFRNAADQEIFALYYQYEGVGADKSNLIWGALPSSGWADIRVDINPGADKLTVTLTATNTKTSAEETRTAEVSAEGLADSDIASIKLITDSGAVSGRDIGIGNIIITQ